MAYQAPKMVQTLSDEALEGFYAQELQRMVRDSLRSRLSAAKASAHVPMYKIVMNTQMGRFTDTANEKKVALAESRLTRFRWDILGQASTLALRQEHWLASAQALVDVRGHLHEVKTSTNIAGVREAIKLIDAWHNVPIMIAQQGPRSIDPDRVDQGLGHRLLAFAKQEVVREQHALATVAGEMVLTATPVRPTL